ncbi:MAG: cytochrome b [Syntrophobacteraceae bacterium]
MIFQWLDERLELKNFKEKFLTKTFPTHPSFLFGEIALFSFINLVVTGIFLGLLYEPSIKNVSLFGAMVPAAYASVVRIDLLPFGMIIRRIHHWSAMIMIASIMIHLGRVYFTSAYRKPREINWLIGLILLAVTILAGFTGYLLPYSEFSVTATSIAYFIAKSVPWVGGWIARFLFAGTFPAPGTIPRFFFLHVMLIPILLLSLIGLHLLILVQQKHTEPAANKKRKEALGGRKLIGIPVWPEQSFISISLYFFLLSVVVLMATYIPLNPVEQYGPPSVSTPLVRPDWYLLPIYGFLKLIPGTFSFSIAGGKFSPETLGGVIFPGILGLLLAAVPFLDRAREPQHYIRSPLHRPVMTSLGLGIGTFIFMCAVAGYIDVLHIAPVVMAIYIGIATVGVWLVSYLLLRFGKAKKGYDVEI